MKHASNNEHVNDLTVKVNNISHLSSQPNTNLNFLICDDLGNVVFKLPVEVLKEWVQEIASRGTVE